MFPVTPYGETKALAEQELAQARRRHLQPDVPAQRHRVRRLDPAAARHRREQPDRDRDDHAVRSGCESDGTPWRPLVHVEDISRAFLAVLEAPREVVHDQAFNVGRDEDVVQVRDIAEHGRARRCPARRCRSPTAPARTCATTGSTSASSATPSPSCGLQWSVRKGVDELYDAYRAARPDARRLQLRRSSSGCAGSRSCSAPAWSTTSCAGRPTTSSRPGRSIEEKH